MTLMCIFQSQQIEGIRFAPTQDVVDFLAMEALEKDFLLMALMEEEEQETIRNQINKS